MIKTKICSKCLKNKLIKSFYVGRPDLKDRARYMSRCKKCLNKINRDRFKNDPALRKRTVKRLCASAKIARKELRRTIFNAYGNKCACCGEDKIEFLAIDHIKGGGYLHWKSRNSDGVYRDIIKMGFPKTKFRLLCHNCNTSLGRFGYCPHKCNNPVSGSSNLP